MTAIKPQIPDIRPDVVLNSRGHAWSAIDHGPATSKERFLFDDSFDGEPGYLVRLQERGAMVTYNHLFDPDAADELADQIKAAAKAVRVRRIADQAREDERKDAVETEPFFGTGAN